MIYEFLKDFHRRAEIVAIVDFITTRVARKTKLREFKFDASETINIVMLVLCFIMEKSLVEEACTKNDVANFIRRLDAEFLKKNIPDEEYLQIVDYIIKDCLQNSGIPHYFPTYNFETKKEEKINVKLIDDKRISVGNDNVYTYYMTPQGYKFMFNTLEIEDSLKVSIEQFKLNLSIKKRNFNAARNNADSLFNISKTQIQRINYFIKRVKEDIGGTGIEEYEKIYNSTFSSIDEQKEGYNNLYELIGRVENSIISSNSNGIQKEALKKEMEDILYIKNRLKFIINEQSNLLLKQQQLQKIYNEAVDNILYIGFENRMNFEDVIIKRLEENPDLAYPLIKVLRPLFMPDTNKFFNIKMALREQRIASTETYSEGSNILMNERYFNRFESESDIRIRDINNKYIDIFEIICKSTLESSENKIMLSSIINELKQEYVKFVPDLKILTNVLLQLCNIKQVDFIAIKERKNKTVFSPSEAFDIKYCVLELLNRDKRYDDIRGLKIFLSRNKKVFIAEEPLTQNSDGFFTTEKVEGLNCPDILFEIEVNRN